MQSENYKDIKELALTDVNTLIKKGDTYGDSWRKRGGIGAYMMAARKWDRIENIAEAHQYDIFKAGGCNDGDILDDIADLRAYLLLIESHVRCKVGHKIQTDDLGEFPPREYVNPDL